MLEEDTGLVLSAKLEIKDVDDHPIRVMTALYEFAEPSVGEIVVKGGKPLRIYAIVHDFDQEPASRASWISSALRHALALCSGKRIASLGLQMLGTRFGPFSEDWFRELLDTELMVLESNTLSQIWLMTPKLDDGP